MITTIRHTKSPINTLLKSLADVKGHWRTLNLIMISANQQRKCQRNLHISCSWNWKMYWVPYSGGPRFSSWFGMTSLCSRGWRHSLAHEPASVSPGSAACLLCELSRPRTWLCHGPSPMNGSESGHDNVVVRRKLVNTRKTFRIALGAC